MSGVSLLPARWLQSVCATSHLWISSSIPRCHGWLFALANKINHIQGRKASLTIYCQINRCMILLNFGRLSLISSLANLLVLPIIPLTMFLGFMLIVFQFIFTPLAIVFSWLAFLPLKYEVEIIKFLASFEFASVEIKNFSWVGVLIWYVILFLILYKFKKPKNKLTKRLA